MGATAPPTIPTDTEEATTSPPPLHPTSTHSQPKPTANPHSHSPPQPQTQPRPQPQSQPQSPPQPLPQPPSQPQPQSQAQIQTQPPSATISPVTNSPLRVTAPTTTSASATTAYSFPPLPFTVSRTSTSVSSSSRVHIQTPFAQISLNQGVDPSILPAPHLRPSLLRLAAEAQNAGHNARIITQPPTTQPSVRARTPANFRDVPRLPVAHLDTSGDGALRTSDAPPRHRQKRQSTPQGLTLPTNFPRDVEALFADLTTSSRLTNTDQPLPSASSSRRFSSRGRGRFRQPSRDQPATVTQQVVQGRASVGRQRQAGGRDSSFVDSQPQRRQRVRPVGRVSVARRPVTASPARSSPASPSFRHRVRIGAETPVRSRPVPSTAPRGIPTIPAIPLAPFDAPRRTPFPSRDFLHEPPTALTAQFHPDSHITVIDEVEATARTDTSPRTPDTTTTTTTTTPSPPFVFPVTSFTCVGKIHGGLYADVETGCKVFHICSVEPDKRLVS